MNIWKEVEKITEKQIVGDNGDDDKCPCCGRPVLSQNKQWYLQGSPLKCAKCGCKYNKFGIVGWKI